MKKRTKHRYKKNNTTKDIIIGHINKNLKEYIILSILFLIGIIIGIFFINNISENQKSEIMEYVCNVTTSIKNAQENNALSQLFNSIKSNLFLMLLLWLAGLIIIGSIFIYGIIIIRGFIFGYTISSFILTFGTWKGIFLALSSLLIQNIIFIPTIFILSISGRNFIKLIQENNREKNIKILIIKHTFNLLIAIFLSVICSLIEVFISRQILSISLNCF